MEGRASAEGHQRCRGRVGPCTKPDGTVNTPRKGRRERKEPHDLRDAASRIPSRALLRRGNVEHDSIATQIVLKTEHAAMSAKRDEGFVEALDAAQASP